MPLPTFLALLVGVLAAAGLSIAAVHLAGLPLPWGALPVLVLALALRVLKWR